MENEISTVVNQPSEMVEFGKKAANLLRDIIEKQEDKLVINKKIYIQFSGWQTIAAFFGSTVAVTEVHGIVDEQKELIGFQAEAVVINKNEKVISRAFASCSHDEPTWSKKPEFMLRSMAQTRACAKALRNVYGWVMVLAGYESTPAEEMTDEKDEPISKEQQKKDIEEYGDYLCVKCEEPISHKVAKFSITMYQKPLCYKHQKEEKEHKDKEKNNKHPVSSAYDGINIDGQAA